jgi:hypothetical protein
LCYCQLDLVDVCNFSKKHCLIFLVALNGRRMRCSNRLFYVFLRKLFRNWNKFSSIALVLANLYVKYFWIIAQYYKIYLNFWLIVLSKHKYLILTPFHAPKIWDKLSVNIVSVFIWECVFKYVIILIRFYSSAHILWPR